MQCSITFLLQGYRSMMGIGVVQSCESALSYYYKAAKKGSVYVHVYMYMLCMSGVPLIHASQISHLLLYPLCLLLVPGLSSHFYPVRMRNSNWSCRRCHCHCHCRPQKNHQILGFRHLSDSKGQRICPSW